MAEELIEKPAEEVEIPAEEGEVEVEIIDDTPPALKKPERKAESAEEDNLTDQSRRVQKRLKYLLAENTEVKREIEIRQREHAAALKFAKDSHDRATWADQERIKAQNAWKTEAAARREAELRASKGEFVAARTAEDPGKEADINAQMARLTAEKSEIDRWQPLASQIPALPEMPARVATTQTPQITEQDQAWLERNPWFEDDENADMKAFTVSMEGALAAKGLTPGSKECYDALDEKVRQAFPDKFSEKPAAASVRRSPSPVVGTPRTNGTRSSNGKITLTASEAAICRQLGISYADYYRNKEAN